jgi:tetratricopeptide (TPR) repeat protein
MKKNYFLSLFVFILFYSYQSICQEKKDSLSLYSGLVNDPKNETDLIKSYTFFNNYWKTSLAKKDTVSAIYSLWYKASIESQNGFIYDSEETSIKALNLLDKVKPNNYLNLLRKGVFNHLGIIYIKQKNVIKAIDLYNKALNFSENKKDSATIYNNIGNAYKSNNDLKKARELFEKGFDVIIKTNDTLTRALILDNLGDVKSKMKVKGAIKDLNNALKLRKKKKNISSLYTSYYHLANYYNERGQNLKAKEYAIKANTIAQTLNSITYKKNALGLILEASNNRYAKQYKLLNDSINLAEQQRKNKFAFMKYDFSKEKIKADEAKLKLVESQLKEEKQKQLKLVYLTIGLFILLTSIFLFFILKSRHKKEKRLEVYKTETRISEKVHDEVANDVYHIMTKLQNNVNINDDILDDLEGIYNKTRDISKENSAVHVDTNFNEILNDLLVSYKSNDINIITKNSTKVNWDKISNEKKTVIYRVLQELMTNMKKHSKATLTVLTFNQTNKLVINYSDNGIGTEIKKHNGLQNTENRINSINGTITFESQIDKGFKATITI